MEEEKKCCPGDGTVISEETPKVAVNHVSVDDMALLFKALGDRRRLYIVARIAREEDLCACKILSDLDISQPTLSHHMRMLTDSGIVVGYRKGKWMHYSLSEDGVRALSLFARMLSGGDHRMAGRE